MQHTEGTNYLSSLGSPKPNQAWRSKLNYGVDTKFLVVIHESLAPDKYSKLDIHIVHSSSDSLKSLKETQQSSLLL